MVNRTNRSRENRLWREAEVETKRLCRKVDGLATRMIQSLDEITADAVAKTGGGILPQTVVEFLAASLMEKDEQLFRWLLESLAAKKIYERKNAEINLHPTHPTAN